MPRKRPGPGAFAGYQDGATLIPGDGYALQRGILKRQSIQGREDLRLLGLKFVPQDVAGGHTAEP
jgi:hypothetical protein